MEKAWRKCLYNSGDKKPAEMLVFWNIYYRIFLSMVGKGGGNFYILAMAAAGIFRKHLAIRVLFTSIVDLLIFRKHKKADRKSGLITYPPTDIMAFVGGYVAGGFSGNIMKIIFSTQRNQKSVTPLLKSISVLFPLFFDHGRC